MTSVRIGGTYRHKKRGTKYEAEGLMKLQINPETLLRLVPDLRQRHAQDLHEALERISFVSYSSKDDDNQIFGRPETEFLDGRFELEEPS